MRPLSELIDTEDPAWPEVQEWIAVATNAVEVLPVNEAHRDSALLAVQVTTRSPMGALVYETGGLLIITVGFASWVPGTAVFLVHLPRGMKDERCLQMGNHRVTCW